MNEDRLVKHLEIIVPCYNEEECISLFYKETIAVLESMNTYSFSFLFVDDGSSDKTLSVIKELVSKDEKRVKYISFTRNFGKEAAIYAGLSASTGDFVVLMDCDLQHPPSVLPQMLEAVENGYDCCAGRRKNRKGEPPARSFFANLFYKLIKKISTVQMEAGATDFRLMSRQMVNAILSLNEYERFTKGLFQWVGFNTKWIDFENVERVAGKTTWSFFSLIKYAVSGIVAFSTAPLRFSYVLGSLVVFGAFMYGIYMAITVFLFGRTIQPFIPLLAVMLLLIGMVILLLGIIGEYLARLYMEVKKRPIFLEKETNITKTRE